jgi:1-aminocyclopropane-1-carboxylate deaminase/D-cysteine desulfhydrase-like pyridoxal-dependent ACC family enzyme
MDYVPALFRVFPALVDRLPWVSLGLRETPLQAVTLQTPGGPRAILVKRDDLSGEPYGGNKLRKLEFILADAEQRGARRLITAGAAGSHHAFATAVYGRLRGFAVELILFPQTLADHVRDVLLMDHGAGARLRFVPRMEMVPFGVAVARARSWREKPYVVAPGGSDAVGTLGYVSAGLELAEQLAASAMPRPRAVHVAAGTLGTAAGLALGLALAEVAMPIKATRITSRIVANQHTLRTLISGAAERLRACGVKVPDEDVIAASVELRHDHIGTGYGRETEAGREATHIFASAGLRLDPTYTAKAAADLLSTPSEELPLFLHTLSAVEPLDLARAADPDTMPAPFRRYVGGLT